MGDATTDADGGSSHVDVVAEATRRAALRVRGPVLLLTEAWRNAPPSLQCFGAAVTRLAPAGAALELPAAPPPEGFATCLVVLDVDHEQLATLLCSSLPPWLRAGAAVMLLVVLPREERVVCVLARDESAGVGRRDAELHDVASSLDDEVGLRPEPPSHRGTL